jgi:hypothetical protein
VSGGGGGGGKIGACCIIGNWSKSFLIVVTFNFESLQLCFDIEVFHFFVSKSFLL